MFQGIKYNQNNHGSNLSSKKSIRLFCIITVHISVTSFRYSRERFLINNSKTSIQLFSINFQKMCILLQVHSIQMQARQFIIVISEQIFTKVLKVRAVTDNTGILLFDFIDQETIRQVLMKIYSNYHHLIIFMNNYSCGCRIESIF